MGLAKSFLPCQTPQSPASWGGDAKLERRRRFEPKARSRSRLTTSAPARSLCCLHGWAPSGLRLLRLGTGSLISISYPCENKKQVIFNIESYSLLFGRCELGPNLWSDNKATTDDPDVEIDQFRRVESVSFCFWSCSKRTTRWVTGSTCTRSTGAPKQSWQATQCLGQWSRSNSWWWLELDRLGTILHDTSIHPASGLVWWRLAGNVNVRRRYPARLESRSNLMLPPIIDTHLDPWC